MLKKKTFAFYIGIIPMVLAIATIVYGLMTRGFIGETFPLSIVVALILAVIVGVITALFPAEWLPIVRSMAYSLGFGMVVKAGAPTLSDYFNGVNFMGGNLQNVCVCIALTGIAVVIGWVMLFLPENKEE